MPAPVILTNVRLFTGAADLTTVSNKVTIQAEREERDATTYLPEGDPDSGWKKVMGGLASASVAASGFWEAGDSGKVDDAAWAALGGLTAWTACPIGAAAGSPAWVMKALEGKYAVGGAPGEIAPWEANASSGWPAVRGKVGHPPGTARTGDGDGTALELSAVSASQNLYAALHVLSVAGTSTPTLTVTIESDVDADFTTPATQLSFTAATAIGGQITRVPGAISDTFYRVTWEITGSTPSFLFLVSLGIF